jgi:hypothetical protein
MSCISFSGTTKFKPFLPEDCQVSGGSYGFELVLWISQFLAKQGIYTSYPFCNANYNPHGGPDWFVEYTYQPNNFVSLEQLFIKMINDDIKILISVGTECNDGDGYLDDRSVESILWHVSGP